MTKPCYRCGQAKDETEFFRSVLTADKLSFHCKECTRKATRVNPDATRRKVAKHTLKKAAHVAVNNALKDGYLAKAPCAICGKEPSVAHHTDYYRPLHVVWLCKTHHMQAHRSFGITGLTDEQIEMIRPINDGSEYGQAASV